ncbi:methyl-accepting chemotaxis protein [Leptospira sp. 'Mane']|uniref:methyl-accepting chemotaxis protein n=1 Tax=Leptospira sp. 'Mane' TaxID=3387407 RepID=UPI00398A57BE
MNNVFLIPPAFAFMYFKIQPSDLQLKTIVAGVIAALIISQVLQISVRWHLKPIKIYLNLFETKQSISAEIFRNARNRYADFPLRIVIGSTIRWLIALVVVSGPFCLQEETTVAQIINFVGIVLFVALSSIIISYLSADTVMRKLKLQGAFNLPSGLAEGSYNYQKLQLSLPILISALMQLSMVMIVLISFNSMKDAVVAAYENQLSNINVNNSSIIAKYYEAREKEILSFTQDPKIIDLIESKNWAALTPILQKIYGQSGAYYENIFVASPQSKTIIATGLPGNASLGISLEDNRNGAMDIDKVFQGELYFSDTFASPVTGEAVIFLSAPVRSDAGKIIAIAAFPFLVGEFVKTAVENVKLGESGYAMILDGRLVSIWHPNPKYILYDFKKEEFGSTIDNLKDNELGHYIFNKIHKGCMRIYNSKYRFSFVTTLGIDEVERSAVKSLFNLLGITLICSLLINLFVIYIMRIRLQGLSILESALGRIQTGDLSEKTLVHTVDELGRLEEGLNKTIDRIASVVGANQIVAESLASSSEEMSVALDNLSSNAQTQAASAEEISASIEQVSAAVQNVDSRAETQLNKVGFLKLKINELSGIIQDIGAEVKIASKNVTAVSEEAKDGQTSLDTMHISISNIDKSSKEIVSVVEIINSISEQINLLALNASIEAARAGVYGRGFAVVADEIGKLADKTAGSIKDIDSLIRANEKEISTGTKTIETVISLIQKIIQGVNSFQAMTDSIEKKTVIQLSIKEEVSSEAEAVNEITGSIRLSMAEQKNAIGEVAQAIFSINDLTQLNAAGLEEMTATSNGLAQSAETLKEKIHFFRLDSNG